MEENNSPHRQIHAGRLRLVVLLPVGWIVFAIILPTFVMGVFDRHIEWVETAGDGIGILLLGGCMAYLLMLEKWLVRVVLGGMGFLLLSVLFRIARQNNFLDNLSLATNTQNVLRQLEIAFNGLGLVMIAFAFFWALIDLLAARHSLMTEQARLSHEIARRKQVEEALRENEAKFEAISTSAPDAIIMMDNEGRVRYWNPAAERILGYSADEILGQSVHDILAPAQYAEAYAKGMLAWQATGRGPVVKHTRELKAIRKDRLEVDIELSVSSVPIAGQWYAVGILRDITARKQAEDALRESEEALRFMIETVDDVFWQTTSELRVTYVSPADERQRGYKPEEVIGHPVTDFMTPQCMEAFRKWFADRKQIREQGGNPGSATYEIEQFCKDGRTIWTEAVSSPIFDSESKVMGFQGITRDITRRKQVEDALRKSEEAMRFMIETVQDVFWQMTPDLRFTYISPAVTKQQGYAPDEVVGRSLVEFLTPESAETLSKVLAEDPALEQAGDDGNVTFEFEIRRKDGSLMRCEALPSAVRDASGAVVAFQGVTRDITRRKQAEEALRQSEAKYRELVQGANSIILRMDAGGMVTFVNRFAQEFLGYAEEEIVGRNVVGTIVPATAADGRDYSVMMRDIAEHPERYVSNENENRCKNGRRVWISWTNRPIYGQDGHLKEILCIGNDVTERVQAQQMLVEQQMRMLNAARLTALGTMASGIAHEINNPMAIISVGAEQLEEHFQTQTEPDDHMSNVARTITRNVGRVHHIIQGLRNLSRDGAADSAVSESVKNVVADTLEVCQARCRNAGILLTVSPIPGELRIQCRVAQLSQVLLNLLNNAYDAVKELPEKWIDLEVIEQDEEVVFSITDSGHGLTEDIHEKVFMPFFTTKRTGEGIGLGLSISRRMVENHNGKLWLDANCPNTRFIMRLPKRTPAELG